MATAEQLEAANRRLRSGMVEAIQLLAELRGRNLERYLPMAVEHINTTIHVLRKAQDDAGDLTRGTPPERGEEVR